METTTIKNSLQVMLQSPILSPKFIEGKVAIQKDLHDLAVENTAPGFGAFVNDVYNTWKLLGSAAGTLDGYVSAIDKLKRFIADTETTLAMVKKS